MANPAVTLIERAPVGTQFMVRARITWTTYATTDVVTAASLGLSYVTHLEVNQPDVLGTNVAWDRTVGASPGLNIYVDDIAGVSAEAAAAANTTVVDIMAFGY